MRALPLLLALLLLCSAALAAAAWLGFGALVEPRLIEAAPRLVLRAAGADGVDAAGLRSALRAAGMEASGAHWRIEGAGPRSAAGAPADPAIEMRAEDARSLGRLDRDVRVERLGGEPAIVLVVPDRGALTRQLVLPLARSRLAAFADAIDAEVVTRRRRSGDGGLELHWVLARHPRGRAAPDVRPPHLEAPKLPSAGGAQRPE